MEGEDKAIFYSFLVYYTKVQNVYRCYICPGCSAVKHFYSFDLLRLERKILQLAALIAQRDFMGRYKLEFGSCYTQPAKLNALTVFITTCPIFILAS